MSGQKGQRNNFWTTRELETLRRSYPIGGIAAALEALPGRTEAQIKGAVMRYQIHMTNRKRYKRVGTTPHIDATIRETYKNATRSPNLAALSKAVGRPRSWVKYRAMEIGVCRPATGGVGIPCSGWTDEEDALLNDFIERGLSASTMTKRFARAGYRRSPTAIRARMSYLDLHFDRPYLTSADVGKILGLESKSVVKWIDAGILKAKKVRGPSCDDEKVTQIHYWGINRRDLADFLKNYPNHWSHRRIVHTSILIELLFPDLTRFAEVRRKEEIDSSFSEDRAVCL